MESKLSRILKAMADDNRLRMLNLLQYSDLCVCELEHLLGIGQSNTSRHLNKLTNVELLQYYKAAKYIYYKINRRSLEEYPFIAEIISSEAVKLEQCQRDYNKLNYYKSQGYTCDDLKAGTVNLWLIQKGS